MKRVFSIMLAVLMFCLILAPMASAYVDEKKGLVSDPSITVLHRLDHGTNTFYFYQVESRVGQTVTLRAVDNHGRQVKVPKGGHAVWKVDPVYFNSCAVKLTPSADGSTCSVKTTKGGTGTLISVQMFDKNNKQTFYANGYVQSKYTVAEWIAEYLTLGLYGINLKHIPHVFQNNSGFTIIEVFAADGILYLTDMILPSAVFTD